MFRPEPPQGFSKSQSQVVIGRPPIPLFGAPQGIKGVIPPPPIIQNPIKINYFPIGDTDYAKYKFYYVKKGQLVTPTTLEIEVEDTLGPGVFLEPSGYDIRIYDEFGLIPSYDVKEINPETGYFKLVAFVSALQDSAFVQIIAGNVNAIDDSIGLGSGTKLEFFKSPLLTKNRPTLLANHSHWFDANWKYRIPLPINAGQVTSPQPDFIFKVDSTFPELIGKSINEIVFAGTDRIPIKHHIQEFNSINGKLIAWGNKPLLSVDDLIYLYHGNDNAINTQDKFAVWDDYESRYSLSQVPVNGVASILDDTINANHGTPFGTSSVLAKNGQGLKFVADDSDYVANGLCVIDFDFTISLWYKTTQNVSGDLFALTSNDAADDHGILVETQSDGKLRFLVREPPGTGGGVDNFSPVGLNDDVFRLIHLVYDSENNIQKMFVDGIQVDSNTNNQPLMSDDKQCTLGKLNVLDMTRFFDGVLNDFRIAKRVYDADRSLIEFNNQNDFNAFFNPLSQEELKIVVANV